MVLIMIAQVKYLLKNNKFASAAAVAAVCYLFFSYYYIFLFNDGTFENGFIGAIDLNSLLSGMSDIEHLYEVVLLPIAALLIFIKIAWRFVMTALPIFLIGIYLFTKRAGKQSVLYAALISIALSDIIILLQSSPFYLLPLDLLTIASYLIGAKFLDRTELAPAYCFSTLVLIAEFCWGLKLTPIVRGTADPTYNVSLLLQYVSLWTLLSMALFIQRPIESKCVENETEQSELSAAGTSLASNQPHNNSMQVPIEQTIVMLKELKTLLDAGAITPEEYESYKQRILNQ